MPMQMSMPLNSNTPTGLETKGVDPGPQGQDEMKHPSAMRQKCTNMTLAISASNANRMLEASRALNASLKSQKMQLSVADKLIPAAKKTSNKLLLSFVRSMQEEVDRRLLSRQEMILSLLLFLDIDKSSKLLTAFEVLNSDSLENDVEKLKRESDKSKTSSPSKNDTKIKTDFGRKSERIQ